MAYEERRGGPEFVSAVPGIGWPAVAGLRAAQTLGIVLQLDHSQWWPADAVVERQFAELQAGLRHAWETVPFYRDRLSRFGWEPAVVLTPRRWRDMPVLGRRELEEAGPAVRSARPPAEHGPVGRLTTAGSTGRPVEILGTAVTELMWSAFTLRDTFWHQQDVSLKMAVIRRFPPESAPSARGQVLDNWGPATAGIIRTGPCVLFDMRRPVGEQVDWLLSEDPAYLLTYPSNALAVVEELEQRGKTLRSLRSIQTLGEVCTIAVRAAARTVLGVPVVDMYSSQEVGYIALQCPTQDRYHVQAENIIVEVLDDAGEPCRPAEVGRVVVTTLHNYAMPLLRYELGDLAEVGAPCRCGRGLPVLTRIVGRQHGGSALFEGAPDG